MKFIYENNGNVIPYNLELSAHCEMENRILPENQRHVEFETDKPNHYHWVGGKVIELTEDEKIASGLISLDDLKKKKTEEVNQICESKILNGFWSNATGDIKHYQSDRDDQLNLAGGVTAGVDMGYKCGTKHTKIITPADENGQGEVTEEIILYDFKPHTAAQLKQVLLDGAGIKSSLLQNANRIKGLIANASNQTELLEIEFDGWV